MSQAHIHFTQKIDLEKDTQFQIQLKASPPSTKGKCEVELHPLNALELQEFLFDDESSPEPITKINITNDGHFFHSALEALGDEDLKQPSRLKDAQAKFTFSQFISKGTFKQQTKAWGYRTMFTPVQDDFCNVGNAIQVSSSCLVNTGNFRYFWKCILQQLFVFQFISFENSNFLVLLDGFDDDFSNKLKRNLINVLREEKEKQSLVTDSEYVGFLLFKSFILTIKQLLDSQLEDINSLNWARTTASILLLKLYSIDQLFALTYANDPDSVENIVLNASKSQAYYKDLIESFLDPYKVKYQKYAEKDLELTKFFAFNVHPFDEKVSSFSFGFILLIPLLFYVISLYDNASIFHDQSKTMVQMIWNLGYPLVKIVGQYFLLKNILWGLSTALNKYVIRSPLVLLLLGGLGVVGFLFPQTLVKILAIVWTLQDENYQRLIRWIGILTGSSQVN